MVELALGTVQFGLAYGLQGRSQPVSDAKAKDILSLAARSGIRRLDTAAAYGDIEERLARLTGDLDFEIVSKIPALPNQASDAAGFVSDAINESHNRLGERMCGVLFHRAADLDGAISGDIWRAAKRCCDNLDVAIGVSVYDPLAACVARDDQRYDMVQVPGSALDQRVRRALYLLGDSEISLRSAFLQGLLLMPYDAAVCQIPEAAAALRRWHDWCERRGISSLVGALSVVKGLPKVRYCVVGVDDIGQFEDILEAWEAAVATDAPELAVEDLAIIDPRHWKRAA